MIRTLSPENCNGQGAQPSVGERMENRVRDSCARLARVFHSGPARFLIVQDELPNEAQLQQSQQSNSAAAELQRRHSNAAMQRHKHPDKMQVDLSAQPGMQAELPSNPSDAEVEPLSRSTRVQMRGDNPDEIQHMQPRQPHHAHAETPRNPDEMDLEPPSRPLKTQVKAVKDLEIIYQEAGKIARKLWTQRTFLKCGYYSDLQNDEFTAESKIYEAHPSHGVEDADDTSLDGNKIMMLLFPVVLAYGNDEAEDYQSYRVWKKGEIYLGDV